MPVDFTGVLIALLLWTAGVGWTVRHTAALVRARPDRAFRPIFWAVWAVAGLTVLALATVWFYDWARG